MLAVQLAWGNSTHSFFTESTSSGEDLSQLSVHRQLVLLEMLWDIRQSPTAQLCYGRYKGPELFWSSRWRLNKIL